jgi:hypothetical protein
MRTRTPKIALDIAPERTIIATFSLISIDLIDIKRS